LAFNDIFSTISLYYAMAVETDIQTAMEATDYNTNKKYNAFFD